jgi:hypothetical protein
MRYLLITFFKKPNGQIDEQVGFSKKIRPTDDQMCNIIIDYKDKRVVKSFVDGKKLDTDFEKINAYYKEIYPDLISQIEKVNQAE